MHNLHWRECLTIVNALAQDEVQRAADENTEVMHAMINAIWLKYLPSIPYAELGSLVVTIFVRRDETPFPMPPGHSGILSKAEPRCPCGLET